MRAFRRLMEIDPMAVVEPAVIFALILLAGWAVRRGLLRVLRAWNARTQSRPGLMVSEAITGPSLIWILILALHLALKSSGLPDRFTDWSAGTLLVLWIVSLTLVGVRLAGNLVRYYGGQATAIMPVTTLTRNLAQLAVVLLGLVLALQGVGVRITPILTALGVGGLAVALALQDTLSNLFAGFYVAVAGQIRLGDYIRLSTGEEGYVTDIGWRSTTIRALANNLIVIPNSKLSQSIVTNYYLPEKRMGAGFQVNVAYDNDPERVERVLTEVAVEGAREIAGMLVDPPPSVTFEPGFGEYFQGFSVNYQIAEFANQWTVRHALRKRIFRRLKEEGIAIPYPTRALYVRSGGDGKAEEAARPPAKQDQPDGGARG